MNLAASSLQEANQSVMEMETKAGDGQQREKDEKTEDTAIKQEEKEEKLAKDDKQSKQDEKNKLSEE